MVRAGNQHCASYIGTLSFPMCVGYDSELCRNSEPIKTKGIIYWTGCILAPPDEYDGLFCARRQRCGLSLS